MTQALFVALGGALGSLARYGAGLAAARLFGLAFPWGTLFVNVLGGLAMGVLFVRLDPAHEQLRLLLGVGVLGGFTTFSSFSLEAVRLAQSNLGAAALYVGASLILSIGACWSGMMLGRPA
jgi:fluoride exporter